MSREQKQTDRNIVDTFIIGIFLRHQFKTDKMNDRITHQHKMLLTIFSQINFER